MKTYSEISAYFQAQQINSSLDKVFQLFLFPSDLSMSNETLQAEFSSHHIFPPTKENGALVPGIDLLRKKRDMRHIPVLSYALAGNIHITRLQWLLRILGAELIKTYTNLEWPLLAIVASSGSQDRLECLLQYYQPTESEWLQGLFFSVYHGHTDLFSFILNRANESKRENGQPELDIHLLKNIDGNTFLQVAILGAQKQAIDFFAHSASYEYLEVRNTRQYRAIDEAVISNNKHLVIQIAYFYALHQKSVNYGDLILVLIRGGNFLDSQKEMLQHLRQNHANDTTFLEDWIKTAIDAHNETIAREFIIDLPHYLDVSDLIAYATSTNAQSIASLLSEEIQARHWIKEVMENIVARLSAYILREKDQLDKLAEKDGLPNGSYKETKHASHAPRRLYECQQVLNNLFYGPYFKEIKQLYKKLPTNSRNATLFSEKIILKCRMLTQKIRGLDKDTRGFNQQIQEIINTAASFFITDFYPISDDLIAESPLPITFSPITNPSSKGENSDDDVPRFTEKQAHYINRFVEQFDQTYQLYKCLSNGDVIRQPDEIDRLAEIAKIAAIGALPDINVSAPMCGVPLPFSISLPSGIAVAAVIDLLLYMRQQTQQNQAHRAGCFFDSWTLRDRVNGIYKCAEFLAERFRDQIALLSHNESLPRLADMAVARIFRRAMGSNSHVQSRTPSVVGAFFRGIASNVINVGPEPEVIRKSLIEVSIEALSTYEHRVLAWDREDEKFLILDEQTSPERFRDWTVKGIFEHTGIRVNGVSYKGFNQNVQKYGFAYASRDEAKKRGMKSTNIVPDFELPISRVANTKMGMY